MNGTKATEATKVSKVPKAAKLVMSLSFALMIGVPSAFAADPFATEEILQRRLERMRERQGIAIIVRKPTTNATTLPRAEARRRARLQRASRTSRPISALDQVYVLINAERTKVGLSALRRNAQLDEAAQNHADDMLQRDYFSHESPEGTLFNTRIMNTGYGDLNAEECQCSFSTSFGENIAKGQQTPVAVVRAWMNSPKHRENILEPNYEDVGYGLSGDVWVQEFGRIVRGVRRG